MGLHRVPGAPGSSPGDAVAPAEQQRSAQAPALLALGLLVLAWGLLNVLQLFRQQDLYPVHKVIFTLDLSIYQNAAELVAQGRSPYEGDAYVAPPLPATLFALLPSSGKGHGTAFAFAALGSVLAAVLVAVRAFFRFPEQDRRIVGACALLFALLGYPTLFLVDRANIDGAVLVLTVLGLAAIYAWRLDALGGMLLGTAIALKIYPVVALVPLVAQRRYRAAAWTVGAVAALVLAQAGGWYEFATRRTVGHGVRYRVDQNGSLTCLVHWVGKATGLLAGPRGMRRATRFTYALWVVLLGVYAGLERSRVRRAPAAADADARDAAAALMVLPFMAAVPSLTYPYRYVILLPLLPMLCESWRRSATARERAWLAVACAGLALSQAPVEGYAKLFDAVGWHAVSPFGLLLLLVSFLALRLRGRAALPAVAGG